MKQMDSADAVWLYIEPAEESMHVSLVCVYEPGQLAPLTLEELQVHLQDRLVSQLPAFRRRLRQIPFHIDFPYWIDESHVDIGRHVRERQVTSPGDWDALLASAIEIHGEPLDKDSPLWDFTLVTGVDRASELPAGSFAIVCRFHHAMVDGKSVMELVGLLHDVLPDDAVASLPTPTPTPTPTPQRGDGGGPSLAAIALRAGAHAIVHPTEMLRRVSRHLPVLGGQLLRLQPKLPPTQVPRTRFNHQVTKDRRLGFAEFDINRLRTARSAAPGCTLNDVALTVIGGALRSYLDALGELPDESLVTACPISVRAEQDGLALGNQVSAMFVPLRTDVASSVVRLEAIAASTRAAKEREEGPVGAKLLTEIRTNMTAAASAAAARLLLLAAHRMIFINTIVTNVPGPQEPIYFMGRRMRMNLPVVALLDGMGMIHIVTSYAGKLSIAFVVDATAMPDPQQYEKLLRASLEELELGAANASAT